MGNIKTKESVNHPEGCIQLLDGSVIKGYASDQIVEEIDNTLRLDTTGVYLRLDNKKREENKSETELNEEEEKLFLKNAWYFYNHAKEIYADSRKFLAPVPVQSGIAYSGTSGFHNPTLGVYVEWWHSCDKAVIELNGEKWLLWHIAGSPLSGSNKCSIVNAEGKSQIYSSRAFIEVWPSFMRVNTRYDECKLKYMAYTLEKTIDLIKSECEECPMEEKNLDGDKL